MKYKEQDPIRSAFNAPTKRGLHPHLLLSDGKENPQSMYEFENEVFDVVKQINQSNQSRLNQLKGIDPNLNQSKSGGILQWIKDHPIISIGTALALGAVVANALSGSSGGEGGDLESLGDLDFERASPRRKNPGTVNTGDNDRVQASLAPAQVIISSPPVYQQTQSSSPLVPNQIITPTSSTTKSSGSDGSVIDAEYTQIKTRRRRKPSKVQVRREDGTFTSKTRAVRKQKRDGTGKFQ